MSRQLKWWLPVFVLVLALGVLTFKYQKGNNERQPDILDKQPSQKIALRLPSFAINLNPAKMADVESRQIATLLHAGLVLQTQDGHIVPMLAQKWQQKGNVWEFELKPGLTFSNGDALTSADVVRSLCNSMQPSAALAWALASISKKPAPDGKTFECIGLSAVSSHVLRIEETKPSKSLFDALGGPAGWILPKPEVKEGAYGVLPGAGAYIVKEIIADNRIVLEPRASGSPVTPQASQVQFDYLPDDTQAAQAFSAGKLHVLDLTSPNLVQLLGANIATGQLKYPGELRQTSWDRYRVVVVNLNALVKKGFSQQQAVAFVKALSANVDRKKLETTAAGVAESFAAPYPPTPSISNAEPSASAFPSAKLSILTESDAFSDSIAAALPRETGGVTADYKGTDKGALLGALFKGDFDLISILFEAPVQSPEFWQALFTPGNPYSAIGTPIAGMEKLDPSRPQDLQAIGHLIADKGNWVALLKERRLQAIAPGVKGIYFTPSGQTNLIAISR